MQVTEKTFTISNLQKKVVLLGDRKARAGVLGLKCIKMIPDGQTTTTEILKY